MDQERSEMKRMLQVAFLAVFGIATLLVPNARAAGAAYDVSNFGQSAGDILYLDWADHDEVSSGKISIVKGSSQVLRFQRTVSRVAISTEEICDIQPLGKHEVLIYAKQAGSVNLIVWDDQSNVASYEVESILDTKKLAKVIHQIDPTSDIELVPFQGTLAVYGTADTLAKIKEIEQAVKSFDGRAIIYVKVAVPKQILLEVRFAEVNRKASQDFGPANIDADRVFPFRIAHRMS